MTNRKLAAIVKSQRPLVLKTGETVKSACASMWARGVGSVLVADEGRKLVGIFTGRDVVKLLAKGDAAAELPLQKVMTRNPTTMTPEERAIDALRLMEVGGFRHVPVVDGGRIWGVVSRGDFKGMEVEALRWIHERQLSDNNRSLTSMLKRRKPLTVTGEVTVGEACQLMAKRKTGSVLVVDKKGRLSGIFTGRDAVRVLAESKRGPSARPIAKVMTRSPVTIAPGCRAIEALRQMCSGGFRHLPVVDNGALLGVVSRSDFTGCECDRLEEEEHLYECLR